MAIVMAMTAMTAMTAMMPMMVEVASKELSIFFLPDKEYGRQAHILRKAAD